MILKVVVESFNGYFQPSQAFPDWFVDPPSNLHYIVLGTIAQLGMRELLLVQLFCRLLSAPQHHHKERKLGTPPLWGGRERERETLAWLNGECGRGGRFVRACIFF